MNDKITKKFFILFFKIVISVLIFFVPDLTLADEPFIVKCKVYVIHAKTEPPMLHSKLNDFWTYFKRSFGRYKYFNLLNEIKRELKKGLTEVMELPNGEKLKLRYDGITETRELFKLKLEIGDLNFDVRVRDGGLFFQAGHSYEKGILILALSLTSR